MGWDPRMVGVWGGHQRVWQPGLQPHLPDGAEAARAISSKASLRANWKLQLSELRLVLSATETFSPSG